MGTAPTADILIVGAGASGATAAKHLASEGFSVVVLDQGSWTSASDLPGDKPEYELMWGNHLWHPDPNMRSRPEDYPTNLDDSEQPVYMYNGMGGSTVFFAGVWSRPMPSDFRVKTMDGVADDWPISYEDLLPFYEATDFDMGVSGLGGNPAYPPGGDPPLPAHPIHLTGRRMAEGLNRLGWHWWPGYSAIPSRAHKNQAQCERLGVCRTGCVVGAKGSADVTLLPEAMQHGARLEAGARVSQITVDEHGLASGAVYFQDGVEKFQPAKVVLVGANGIGTPRLLLMSESARHPNGLANSSDLVGRRLMLHPFGSVIGLYDDDLEDWVGPAGTQIECMEFYETDLSRGFVRGSKWHVMGTGGPLEMATRWHIGEGVSEEPFWGEQFTAKMKQAVGHSVDWIVHAEDLPEEHNRVTLDHEKTDSDGLPGAKITYKTSDNTHRILDFGLNRALEAHEAAGATKAWITFRNFSSGHNLGTAKMGDDPETSVVNRWGQAHDVPNLYVIDGSVFTTSTATNPTATICALARRTAAYLVENRREQKVSTA
ncbi:MULTISPECIES: GMC family oxidoreductase [unclassified Nocardioides]|uniref:GMC family oxidoreductase n=1 Tax=unclassified Nocardioides TaxID=2615069 RepID=UPI0009F111F6|nr:MULTISPECIES: GMC family oxidoreductase [unclassified Nocardioides]GAW48701.1 GMC oxidoreductase [Nocardioides sp. PD653-B2]GAW54338.1 GMC oxidoreductase [Nocardioides sp. PD653]